MSTPVQQGKVQSGVSKHRYQRQKKANAQLNNQVGNGTLGHKTIGQTANQQQGINVTKAKAQLSNQVGYGPLGHKTVKQNNHKVITVGQSPATWDRTDPRNLLQMTAKGEPGCHSPAFGKRSHTQTTTY